MSPQSNDNDKERMARIETYLEMMQNQAGERRREAKDNHTALLSKIDALDAKLEARISKLEEHATQDAADLRALKARGAGFLAAVGMVFTLTATLFSDFFSNIKHAIFG